MRAKLDPRQERASLQSVRALADQAFSRAAGCSADRRKLRSAATECGENYPAWLDAIGTAKRHIYFESYIIHEDDIGLKFADALIAKAQQGVRVRLIYDWMGGFGKLPAGSGIVCVRAGSRYDATIRRNSIAPLGWLSRDHRKMLAVDGEVGFIAGFAWDGCGWDNRKRRSTHGVIQALRYEAMR